MSPQNVGDRGAAGVTSPPPPRLYSLTLTLTQNHNPKVGFIQSASTDLQLCLHTALTATLLLTLMMVQFSRPLPSAQEIGKALASL